MDQSLIDKFWSRFDKSQGAGGHWFCIYHVGYLPAELRIHGAPTVNLGGCAKAGHRWAYILTYGPLPERVQVRHRCGYGGCCNPAHLCPGSAEENSWDRWARAYAGVGPDVLCTYEDVPEWIPPRMRKAS